MRFLSFLAALCLAGSAFAQAYPSKPIKMLVAYPPGGANDLLARVVGQKLNEAWGQPVVVENKPGANAVIGTEQGKNSPPDGYTMIMGATGSHTINPALYDRLPYDPLKDFVPVSLVASAPIVFIVHPSVPATTIKELVALAKQQPGKLNYAAGASIFHLAMELFKAKTGTDIVYVPYRGSVPALTDLLAAQVQIDVDVIQTPLPHMREGKARALAVTSRQRSFAAPHVPTMIEAGIPDYEMTAWSGLYVPAGTPLEIVEKLAAEVRRIVREPDVKEKVAQVGYEPVGSTPDEFAALMRREIETFRKIVADAKIPKLD
jgi:tripartite-type tricarboxylate transporter receptor subunit TctC